MSRSVIAIIGGGFCGVVSAVRLLESGAGTIRKIILVEKQARVGRGVAYGTHDDCHLLNVPAGQMSAFAEDPQHFLRYARGMNVAIGSGDFVPRKLYGQYLESLLQSAVHSAATRIEFVRIMDCATDIHATHDGLVAIAVANGQAISADKVIIASGNLPSRNPFGTRNSDTLYSARYINNPWAAHALDRIDFSQPVLILGSGLTAIDLACSLEVHGFTHTIHMVSRHGLKVLAHSNASCNNTAPAPTTQLLNEFDSIRGGLRALRAQIQLATQQGHDWRAVLSGLRRHTPRVWQHLSLDERRRFLRHVQRHWDIHRHRVAPGVARTMDGLAAAGRLQQHAGRVTALTAIADHFRADIQLRQSNSALTLKIGTIVNCTGLCTDLTRTDDSLLANLQRRGLCSADALGLGIECDGHYALIDSRGRPSSNLFYVGPYLRAKFWEATAVPELREHVASLAKQLVTQRRVLPASDLEMRLPA